MPLSFSHILLIAQQPQSVGVDVLTSSLRQSLYSVAIANTEEQAVAQTRSNPPFLIILAGDYQNWSDSLLQELRSYATEHRTTLVAVTDTHAPSWLHQEENPGFDGFLVSPISSEVLCSLVHTAHTRQSVVIAR